MTTNKIITFLTLSIFTSCATLVNGQNETVSIATDPPGAVVTNGVEFGITPTTFTLERAHDYTFIALKPGYAPENIRLHHKLSGWTFGNIISFGVIGAGIDSATGAIWRLDPETITLHLEPQDQK